MAEANAHYYATRDPLGVAGDFVTAPEISQMFGELIGLWLADIWMRSGRRANPLYVELGPGRGTLAADALRAMAQVELAPAVHLVETSPVLRDRQRAAVPTAQFHDDFDSVPDTGPLLVVANEFFDALPVRQLVRTENGWRERVVVNGDGIPGKHFVAGPGVREMDAAVPERLRDALVGAVLESCPASAAVALAIGRRVMRQGGAALFIDYGYEGPAFGDTLQAVRAHRMTNPFAHVGDSDLTTHVDFAMLANIGRQAEVRVLGPTGQGAFLTALGIEMRAALLAREVPDRAAEIEVAHARLTASDQMGTLFKVLAYVHPDWPTPEGFSEV